MKRSIVDEFVSIKTAARVADLFLDRTAKAKTFSEARTEFQDHLEKKGWKLSDRSMKIPYATSPDGEVRVYFKTQAVYISVGTPHTVGNARSLNQMGSDLKKGPEFMMKEIEHRVELEKERGGTSR